MTRNLTGDRLPLLVIDPAIRTPAQAATARLMNAVGTAAPVTVVCPALDREADLSRWEATAFSGLIVLGSAASVNDDHDWLRMLRAWLRPVALSGRVPVLGICFGHQLLAHVLGGKVGRLFPEPIRGLRTCTLRADALPWWPEGQSPTVSLFHSHGEAVVTVPPGGRVLAESPVRLPCGTPAAIVEALAYDGLPVWSFQPHPESTPAFLTEQGCAALLEQPATHRALADGWALVTAFVRYCLDPAGRRLPAQPVA